MGAEVLLSIISLGILFTFIVSQYFLNKERGQYFQEREKLYKALIARNLNEVTQNEIAEKQPPADDKLPEFTPVENADNEEFDKAILKQLGLTN